MSSNIHFVVLYLCVVVQHRKRRENVDGLAPFNTYIYRVLKSLHPTLGVSKRGMEVRPFLLFL